MIVYIFIQLYSITHTALLLHLCMGIAERIAIVIKSHNLTNSAFADQLGVQRSNISHILSGRSKPGLDFLQKVLLNFPKVNAEWLVTGRQDQQVPKADLRSVPTTATSDSTVNTPQESKEKSTATQSPDKEVDYLLIVYKDKSFDRLAPNGQ